MRIILVTEMNCFTGRVGIVTSCMANEDGDAQRMVDTLKPMAEQMSMEVHCFIPDTQHDAIEHLTSELAERAAEAEKEAEHFSREADKEEVRDG